MMNRIFNGVLCVCSRVCMWIISIDINNKLARIFTIYSFILTSCFSASCPLLIQSFLPYIRAANRVALGGGHLLRVFA